MDPVDWSTLHCSDFDEDIATLHELSTDIIVEATGRCLRIINDDSNIPVKLPPSMSARFRIGTSVATAVKVSTI